jgi:hypothetical protein
MFKHKSITLLQGKILMLEENILLEKARMSQYYADTKDELKPINLLRKVLTSSPIKENIVDAAVGMTAGYLAKKLIVRTSHHPLMNMFGSLIQFAVSRIIENNPEAIKSIGEGVLKVIFAKRQVK